MRQRRAIPDMDALGRLAIEHMPSGAIALVGAREGTNQIQLRAGIDHPANAAKNTIHFAKSPKSIDVHRRKARCLNEQFLVGHKYPRNKFVSSRGPSCVGNLTHSKRNHVVASSQIFARCRWSKLNTSHIRVHIGASA